MAIHIKPSLKTNPRDPEAPVKYYPRTLKQGHIDLDTLADLLSERSTLTPAECYGVVVGLTDVIAEALADGKVVEIGPLGSFRLSVQGTGVETAEGFSLKQITKTNIVFKSGKRWAKALKELQFIISR
jgi:predicted histone-like DNA-binding protein